MKTLVSSIVALLLAAGTTSLTIVRGWAGRLGSGQSQHGIRKLDEFIPMRDGVRLHTEIYVPEASSEALPILLERTPYGLGDDENGFSRRFAIHKELIADGYIFALQDVRGRFQSEGQFVMLRAPRDRSNPNAIDESTDAYDTIDWLLKNTPNNNGRVGVLGISYGGWLTMMAAIDPHPALKAISEQATCADMFIGDDFHHNGAFRLSMGFEYAAQMETSNSNTYFKFDMYDAFDWYLKLGALSNVDRHIFHGRIPTWENFVAHPNYDEFWQTQGCALVPYLTKATVPNLNVAGWWDQEDFYGPMKVYETLEKIDLRHLNYLVVGPWNHGGWARSDGRSLGPVDFSSDTSKYFREQIEAPWFAHWLKDKGTLPKSAVLAFQTGSNKWENYSEWPPQRDVAPRALYFRSDGGLSFEAPRANQAPEFDNYISDPAHPVPYRPRPIAPMYPGPEWPTWLVQDQRFADSRPDVVSYETKPLEDDVVVAGNILAHLFASTSGSDSDWVVKLIDVYPESYPESPKMGGYQLIIADDVLRARFRSSFKRPQPLIPNQVIEYRLDLHTNDHCFRKGHQIMVQVQSTWFPLIDRNPQKFVPNIFEAKDADFQKATQRIYRSKKYPSNIELSVKE